MIKNYRKYFQKIIYNDVVTSNSNFFLSIFSVFFFNFFCFVLFSEKEFQIKKIKHLKVIYSRVMCLLSIGRVELEEVL